MPRRSGARWLPRTTAHPPPRRPGAGRTTTGSDPGRVRPRRRCIRPLARLPIAGRRSRHRIAASRRIARKVAATREHGPRQVRAVRRARRGANRRARSGRPLHSLASCPSDSPRRPRAARARPGLHIGLGGATPPRLQRTASSSGRPLGCAHSTRAFGLVVLTYPYPEPPYAGTMLWQAIDDFGFRLLGAYATIRTPSGTASLAPPLTKPAYVQEFLATAEAGRHKPLPTTRHCQRP